MKPLEALETSVVHVEVPDTLYRTNVVYVMSMLHCLLLVARFVGFVQLKVTLKELFSSRTADKPDNAESFCSSHTVNVCVADTGDARDPFFAVTVHVYFPASAGVISSEVLDPLTRVSVVFELESVILM